MSRIDLSRSECDKESSVNYCTLCDDDHFDDMFDGSSVYDYTKPARSLESLIGSYLYMHGLTSLTPKRGANVIDQFKGHGLIFLDKPSSSKREAALSKLDDLVRSSKLQNAIECTAVMVGLVLMAATVVAVLLDKDMYAPVYVTTALVIVGFANAVEPMRDLYLRRTCIRRADSIAKSLFLTSNQHKEMLDEETRYICQYGVSHVRGRYKSHYDSMMEKLAHDTNQSLVADGSGSVTRQCLQGFKSLVDAPVGDELLLNERIRLMKDLLEVNQSAAGQGKEVGSVR